jgi:hypothetical protein
MNPLLFVAIVCEALTMAALAFLPFGFDHPSELGLDFWHIMLVAAIHVVALLVGIIVAIKAKQPRLAIAQFAATLLFCLLVVCGVINI